MADILGFLAVPQFWPGPKSFSSQVRCPDVQTVREALIGMTSQGAWGEHCSPPRAPNHREPQQRGVPCLPSAVQPCPDPAEVVREREHAPAHGM